MKTTTTNEVLQNKPYRRALTIVFNIHVVMFFVVLTAGIIARSSAVLADSLDFIGDAANYALSLYVLDKTLRFRSYAAIIKAVTMLCGGVPIFLCMMFQYDQKILPNYEIMSLSGILGIIAHGVCIYYLYKFRSGDSNVLSVWICTINDLISNCLLIFASILVMLTGSIIPDLFAATIIVGLAFLGACTILRTALNELRKK